MTKETFLKMLKTAIETKDYTELRGFTQKSLIEDGLDNKMISEVLKENIDLCKVIIPDVRKIDDEERRNNE